MTTQGSHWDGCWKEHQVCAWAEIDRLRAERDALAALLPGVYYMDPPDGGQVELIEQFRRMADDAARYQWLRGNGAIWERTAPGHLFDYGIGLDAAIDAALKGKP